MSKINKGRENNYIKKITASIMMVGLLSGCIDEFRGKINSIIGNKNEQKIAKIIFNIDTRKEIEYIKKNKGELVYVLYKGKKGNYTVVKRPFFELFLEGEIYKFTTSKGDEDILFVSLDRLNKEELPKKYIVEGVEINIMNGDKIGSGKKRRLGLGKFVEENYISN